MWIVRELLRIALRIAVVLVIAGVASLLASNHHKVFQLVTIIGGAFLMVMAAMAPGTGADRRMRFTSYEWGRQLEALAARAERYRGPTLTPGAAFLFAGAITVAIGIIL